MDPDPTPFISGFQSVKKKNNLSVGTLKSVFKDSYLEATIEAGSIQIQKNHIRVARKFRILRFRIQNTGHNQERLKDAVSECKN